MFGAVFIIDGQFVPVVIPPHASLLMLLALVASRDEALVMEAMTMAVQAV